MSAVIRARLDALTQRAALRSLSIRRAPEPPYGWELASPYRVVCRGSLDNLDAWLTAAEQRDAACPMRVPGMSADH